MVVKVAGQSGQVVTEDTTVLPEPDLSKMTPDEKNAYLQKQVAGMRQDLTAARKEVTELRTGQQAQAQEDEKTEEQQKAANTKQPGFLEMIMGFLMSMFTGSTEFLGKMFNGGKDMFNNAFGGGGAETPKVLSYSQAFDGINGIDKSEDKRIAYTYKALKELQMEPVTAQTKDEQTALINERKEVLVKQIKDSLIAANEKGDDTTLSAAKTFLGDAAVYTFLNNNADSKALEDAITAKVINAAKPSTVSGSRDQYIEYSGLDKDKKFTEEQGIISKVSAEAARTVLAAKYLTLEGHTRPIEESKTFQTDVDLAARQMLQGEQTGTAAEKTAKTAAVIEFLKREGVENPETANNLEGIKSAIGKFLAVGGKGGQEQAAPPNSQVTQNMGQPGGRTVTP